MEGRLWKAKYFGMISGSKSSSSFRAAVKASAVRAAMADVSLRAVVGSALGARWRDLPERFGPYQTAKRRYYRWIEMGVFDRLFEAVASQPDLESLMIDATVIRAQSPVAGARRKRGDLKPRLSAARGVGSAPASCCR